MGFDRGLACSRNASVTKTTELLGRNVNLQFCNISVHHRLEGSQQIVPLLAEKGMILGAPTWGQLASVTNQGLLTLQANNFKCISWYSLYKTLNPLFMISCRGAWTVCCGTVERPTLGLKVSKLPQIKCSVLLNLHGLTHSKIKWL